MVSGLHPQEPQSVDREFGSCAVDPPGGEGRGAALRRYYSRGDLLLLCWTAAAGWRPVAVLCATLPALVEQFAKAYGPLSVGTVKVFP